MITSYEARLIREKEKRRILDELDIGGKISANDMIVKQYKEIERLHSIIKEAKLYIYNHREPVDEKNQKIIYFLTDDFDEEDILEILDKVGSEKND